MGKSFEISRLEIEILRVLSESAELVGSRLIQRELGKTGFLNERIVRYQLQSLKLKGLVVGHERSGRTITSQGLAELSRASVSQRVGFINMFLFLIDNFLTDSGRMVANVSIMDKSFMIKCLRLWRGCMLL